MALTHPQLRNGDLAAAGDALGLVGALAPAWREYFLALLHNQPRFVARRRYLRSDIAGVMRRLIPEDTRVLEVGVGGDVLASFRTRSGTESTCFPRPSMRRAGSTRRCTWSSETSNPSRPRRATGRSSATACSTQSPTFRQCSTSSWHTSKRTDASISRASTSSGACRSPSRADSVSSNDRRPKTGSPRARCTTFSHCRDSNPFISRIAFWSRSTSLRSTNSSLNSLPSAMARSTARTCSAAAGCTASRTRRFRSSYPRATKQRTSLALWLGLRSWAHAPKSYSSRAARPTARGTRSKGRSRPTVDRST